MTERPGPDKPAGNSSSRDELDVPQVEATERATRPVRPVLIIGFAVAVVCLVFALVAAARWL
jgi:hypothetical protein